MASASNINLGGMIENTKNAGFTVSACIRELIDNSIDAKATKITITLNKKNKEFVLADNGIGIHPDNITSAFCLHNRTQASSEKQGRFGIGGKAARINLTEARKTSTCYTKQKDTNLMMVQTNWDNCVKENTYNISPVDCTSCGISPPHWEKYKIGDSGFIQHACCTDKMFDKIVECIETSDHSQNIRHTLGRDYFKAIKNGVEIKIRIEDSEYEYAVESYDPLFYNVDCDDVIKSESIIILYKNHEEDKIKSFWKHGDDEFSYNVSTNRKNKDSAEKLSRLEWICVGHITIKHAYCSDWNTHIRLHFINSCGVDEKLFKEKSKSRQFRSTDNCIHLQRLGKIICSIPTRNKPTSGDKVKYKFTDESRHIVEFCEIHDNEMGVQTNKSYIREEDIATSVRGAIRECVKAFCETVYHEDRSHIDSSEESSGDDLTASTPKSKTSPPATATTTPATPKPSTATPKPSTPKPATLSTATPKPSTATPKPSTATPKPSTATPKPSTATAKPATAKPATATTKPSTPTPATPKPSTPTPATAKPATAKPATATTPKATPATVRENELKLQDCSNDNDDLFELFKTMSNAIQKEKFMIMYNNTPFQIRNTLFDL